MDDATCVENYEPKRDEWRQIWQDLSPTLRMRRFSNALKRQAALQSLATRDSTESERAAVVGIAVAVSVSRKPASLAATLYEIRI